MRLPGGGISVAIAVTLLAGCAARGPRAARPASLSVGSATDGAGADGALSEYMRKIRHLSVAARPLSQKDAAETLEAGDPGLAADLLLLASAPSGERHRAVAERYRDLGVLDAAYRHFNSALAFNPHDGRTYEGLARVWRDWGLPQLAVGDAHRATFYDPRSASARNTYGTIMQALGHDADAGAAYELALRLDPNAAYAVNNLCYLAFTDGRLDDAVGHCTEAMRMDPSLAAARNNLALTFAAAGRMDIASRQFGESADIASGHYNTGIAYLASGDESDALVAFDKASKARATFNISRERAALIRARLGLAAAAARRDHPVDR